MYVCMFIQKFEYLPIQEKQHESQQQFDAINQELDYLRQQISEVNHGHVCYCLEYILVLH